MTYYSSCRKLQGHYGSLLIFLVGHFWIASSNISIFQAGSSLGDDHFKQISRGHWKIGQAYTCFVDHGDLVCNKCTMIVIYIYVICYWYVCIYIYIAFVWSKACFLLLALFKFIERCVMLCSFLLSHVISQHIFTTSPLLAELSSKQLGFQLLKRNKHHPKTSMILGSSMRGGDGDDLQYQVLGCLQRLIGRIDFWEFFKLRKTLPAKPFQELGRSFSKVP